MILNGVLVIFSNVFIEMDSAHISVFLFSITLNDTSVPFSHSKMCLKSIVSDRNIFVVFRSKKATLTDSRIRTMNEVVSGIRIIKMYAWEKPFAALVSDIRR